MQVDKCITLNPSIKRSSISGWLISFSDGSAITRNVNAFDSIVKTQDIGIHGVSKQGIAIPNIIPMFVMHKVSHDQFNSNLQPKPSGESVPNPVNFHVMWSLCRPGVLFFTTMQAQTPPATLSPGIEEAINKFFEDSDDLQSLAGNLNYIFNTFIASEDFANLEKVDRSELSYDFRLVVDLMQTLKRKAEVSGYEITPDGIQEGRAAA